MNTIMSSVKEQWRSILIRDLKDSETISEKDPFKNWDLNTAPDSHAERLLKYALEVVYADPVHPLASKFLDQCLAVCERAIKEDKVNSERCKDSFPRNRGQLKRTFAYANVLTGKLWDPAELIGAAKDIVTWYGDYSKGEWARPQSQAVYLGAARMTLLVGDSALSIEILSVKRKFKHHQTEFDLLQKLAAVGPDMGENENFFAEVEGFFNTIRNPMYDPGVFFERDIAAFEWGAIRDKYFISEGGVIDWKRVIEAVSR